MRPAALSLGFALIAIATAQDLIAQTYPSRPLRLVSASAPGSGSDVVARILSIRLAELLGQQVVVDNRAGASGLIGAELVAKATPDGHTMWLATFTQLISTTLHNRFRLEKEFTPVGLVATTPFIIVASGALPVKNTAEFIAYARARPGQLLFGSSGSGTTPHLCMEMFAQMAGLKMTHVPYKGIASAVTDLMAGQVHAACPAAPTMTLFANNAKVRVLGVTSPAPTALAPGVPPIAEALPGYDMPGWYGVLMPLGTPREIVARLHQEFARAVASAETRERLIAAGAEPAMTTPAQFSEFLRRESQRLDRLLKDVGVRAP